ncbi:MAG: pseudouridine synthase [Acidiferrobacterales bacterium]|nr:pseudouridine synthase [Acidiferrobacterales bacterium]
MSERIQKYLARKGFGSRREIEQWIKEGRVRHDGGEYKLGDRVEYGDLVVVDDRHITVSEGASVTRVIAYHKKSGEVCSRNDPANRPLTFDSLPPIEHGRWVSVGRLDLNTTGLLLFTNDGSLANSLMHPANEIEREYLCRVFGEVSEQKLMALRTGVRFDGEILFFNQIETLKGKGSNQWYRIILKQGRNREIRRAWEAVGNQVSRLKRVRYGSIVLDNRLPQGKWKELDRTQTSQLMQSVKSTV